MKRMHPDAKSANNEFIESLQRKFTPSNSEKRAAEGSDGLDETTESEIVFFSDRPENGDTCDAKPAWLW